MIQVKDVSKVYGPTRALDCVSFEVEDRQILGFLGPNGAGKSTAMKIITTYIAPTEGTVLVDGLDVDKQAIEIRRKIGYLPETNPLYADMRVDDYLRFCGEARGMDKPELRRRFDWVVEECGLKPVLKKDINELSKGYKQRTGLAQALIHDPEILILDEPTSGLDPLQIIGIRGLIQRLAETKTIIFSTHILQEVTSTTDRIIIINNGHIIADGYIGDLKDQARGSEHLRVGLLANREDVEGALMALDGIIDLSMHSGPDGMITATIQADLGTDLRVEVGKLIAERAWPVVEMSIPELSLEDAFIEFIKESNAGSGKGVHHA